MWDFVGGRVSVTSAVGMLPAALQGIDIEEIFAGAREMDEITRSKQGMDNPSMALAMMWYYAGQGRGSRDMVMLPYKDRLVLFSKYLQQLIMESLGKKTDLDGNIVHQGLTVFGNKGSTDQHAYVQQLREGLNNFFVTFIEVLADCSRSIASLPRVEVDPGVTSGDYLEGFLLGTRTALAEVGRESLTISIDELSPRSLGSLIALFERAVGFYAFMININAYHQPGVEGGKAAAKQVIQIQTKLLSMMRESRSPDAKNAEQLAALIGLPDEVEIVFKLLDRMSRNPGSDIVGEGSRNPQEARFRLKC